MRKWYGTIILCWNPFLFFFCLPRIQSPDTSFVITLSQSQNVYHKTDTIVCHYNFLTALVFCNLISFHFNISFSSSCQLPWLLAHHIKCIPIPIITVTCFVPIIHNILFLFIMFCRYLNMDSRFAHLRQRDTSVSMLRVKMSRRRSQSQKENRERTVNTRRQLEKLPELEVSSLDASIAMANMSTIQEKTLNNTKLAKSKTSCSIS